MYKIYKIFEIEGEHFFFRKLFIAIEERNILFKKWYFLRNESLYTKVNRFLELFLDLHAILILEMIHPLVSSTYLATSFLILTIVAAAYLFLQLLITFYQNASLIFPSHRISEINNKS